MKEKFALKKIIAYLLMFTVVLGLVQSGNVHIAKAADNDATFLTEVILKADNDTLKVDTVSDVLTCEKINMGTKAFTIEGNTGYKVTDVTYNGNLTKVIGGTTTAPKYTFNVNQPTDFDFTITVQSTTDTTVTKMYTVKMKFDTDSLFQFDSIRLTYTNSQNVVSTGSIDFDDKGTDGYYRQSVEDNINKAKVELISGSYVMTTGVTIKANTTVSDGNTVDLIGGDNPITITITRNNISRQFDLIISKKGQPLLDSLVPSAGTLDPVFDSNSFDYTLNVPTTQTTIAFTPTSVDNASTIKVGNNVVKSGKKSGEVSLSEGSNKIAITVTTKESSKSYTVNVIRAEKYRSSNLSALALSSGTLNPAFNKEIYDYTASVENTVSSITVTPTAEDPTATIKVNGKKIPSGATSGYINLSEGGNLISVTVTDTKGYTNTYTINLTRKYSADNVNLGSLSVTDGTLSPKFDPETYLYSVKTARNIEKVRVLFTSQNDKATVKINGKEYKTGEQSDYIKLDIGANLVTVEVTAEDGTTTTTYKLSVIRGEIEGTNQWVLVGGEWTFYNAAGLQIKNQWVKYDNQWYFMDINGYRKTGWLYESDKWYYLNKDGIMQTGWFYDKGYWYYLQGDGSMRVNSWGFYDGNWYYYNNFGEIQTGWLYYLGKWYYMDEHGVMQKGWITYDKNKYYINDDGSMRKGWLYNGKVWYYLDDTGKMITGWKYINGKNYYFDASGTMKTGMMFLDGQWINLNNA